MGDPFSPAARNNLHVNNAVWIVGLYSLCVCEAALGAALLRRRARCQNMGRADRRAARLTHAPTGITTAAEGGGKKGHPQMIGGKRHTVFARGFRALSEAENGFFRILLENSAVRQMLLARKHLRRQTLAQSRIGYGHGRSE